VCGREWPWSAAPKAIARTRVRIAGAKVRLGWRPNSYLAVQVQIAPSVDEAQPEAVARVNPYLNHLCGGRGWSVAPKAMVRGCQARMAKLGLTLTLLRNVLLGVCLVTS